MAQRVGVACRSGRFRGKTRRRCCPRARDRVGAVVESSANWYARAADLVRLDAVAVVSSYATCDSLARCPGLATAYSVFFNDISQRLFVRL